MESNLSNSKLNSEDENVLDNSTSSSVQEVSTKAFKLENEASSPTRPSTDAHLTGQNELIKCESHSSISDQPVEVARSKEENDKSFVNHHNTCTTSSVIISSAADPLTVNSNLIITSTAGQPFAMPSALPNPFLPTGLQVPMFDPVFASNSKFRFVVQLCLNIGKKNFFRTF